MQKCKNEQANIHFPTGLNRVHYDNYYDYQTDIYVNP